MSLPRHALLLRVLPAAILLLPTACAPKTKTDVGQVDKPVTESMAVPTDVAGRVKVIQDLVNTLESQAAALPGTGATGREADAANRQLMRQGFDTLNQLLPMIEGENQTGDFRQALRVMDATRQQLANGSPDLAAEPTIAQGVRAVARLLASVNTFVFNNDPALAVRIDALQKTVDQLDVTRGAISRAVSARAMREAAGTLGDMSNNLASRVGPASTQPASTQPSATK